MPVREELPLGCELGEGRPLVVAALGEARERLVVEDVDAGVDPVGQLRRLVEALDRVVVRDLDDAEAGRQRSDDDRRRAAVLAVRCQQRGEVGVDKLVAVQRVERARLLPRRAAKRRPPPRPSGSGSSTVTTRAETRQLGLEELAPGRPRS